MAQEALSRLRTRRSTTYRRRRTQRRRQRAAHAATAGASRASSSTHPCTLRTPGCSYVRRSLPLSLPLLPVTKLQGLRQVALRGVTGFHCNGLRSVTAGQKRRRRRTSRTGEAPIFHTFLAPVTLRRYSPH